MKTEIQLLEECIEEKTKELYRATASLQETNKAESFTSFQTQQLIGHFETQQTILRIQNELNTLLQQRAQLVGDFIELEVIKGSRKEVLEQLTQLSDGLYKLMKIERKTDGER